MTVTKQDILNDLQLVKKGLQEVEFYIMNYTNEENIIYLEKLRLLILG